MIVRVGHFIISTNPFNDGTFGWRVEDSRKPHPFPHMARRGFVLTIEVSEAGSKTPERAVAAARRWMKRNNIDAGG